MPENLPAGWASTTIGDLVTIVRGVSYKKVDARSESGRGLVPVLRATNIGQALDFQNLVYVPDKYVKHEQMLRSGDIIIAASSGSPDIVGKAAQLRHDWTGSFGAFCFTLRPDGGLTREYIAWFLQTQDYRTRVSGLAAGVNINNLKREHIEGTTVALPPFNEQRRIVAEIEKQFTRLDASVASLKRMQANLKRYRASVLKAACEGRLVPTEAELARAEGRNYEPADQLLERILAERQARWESQEKRRGKYKEPASPDTSELPDLPEGWVWGGLSTLIYNLDALRVPVKAKDRAEMQGPYPYYGASGVIDSVASYLFDGTFLLVAEDGANLLSRSTPIAFVASGKFWVNNHAHVLNLVAQLSVAYLEAYINGLNVRQHVTGTAQPKLTQTALNRIPIPLPPHAEQRRIVAEVERRLSLIQKAEDVVEANLKKADRLRQSILKQAFSGRLAPQDPDDEPASALLERIRAEREAAEAAEKNERRSRRGRGKGGASRKTAGRENKG